MLLLDVMGQLDDGVLEVTFEKGSRHQQVITEAIAKISGVGRVEVDTGPYTLDAFTRYRTVFLEKSLQEYCLKMNVGEARRSPKAGFSR